MSDKTKSNLSALLAQIGKSLSKSSKQDAKTSKELHLAARKLSRAMEKELGDIVERV